MTVPRVLQYKVGDVTTSGQKIEFIYGHSDSVIVFRDADERVQWETAGAVLSSTESTVVQRFDRLYGRLLSCVPEGRKREDLKEELAAALFLGLSESDIEKALKQFETAAGRIAHEAGIEARFKYLVAGTGAAALVLVPSIVGSLFASPDARSGLVALAAGALGAWTSVLTRASRLELGSFETPRHLTFQGVTRILLGVVFGLVAFVGIKTGQLFPAAQASIWTVALATFVSGWSERIVPEIISKLESRDAKATLQGSRTPTA